MDVDPPSAPQAVELTDAATKLIERVILDEVDDAQASLAALCQTVAQIQSLLTGSSPEAPAMPSEPGAAPTIAPAASPTASDTKPAASTPQVAAAEGPFSADDLPLIREFITESSEHLQAAEAEILKLEDNVSNNEAIHGIFRSFHTIKGVAGFLNLKQIASLAHAAENLLDLARRSRTRPHPPGRRRHLPGPRRHETTGRRAFQSRRPGNGPCRPGRP
ncbi:MAG: Hpt domain-containing protein [Verrucomicrobiota bacterium]